MTVAQITHRTMTANSEIVKVDNMVVFVFNKVVNMVFGLLTKATGGRLSKI